MCAKFQHLLIKSEIVFKDNVLKMAKSRPVYQCNLG